MIKLKDKHDFTFILLFSEPETLCYVGILLFLLDHKTPLPPEGEHSGEDGELLHARVDVVQPELVHRQEGSSSSHSGAAVHQNRAWQYSGEQQSKFCHLLFGLTVC